MAEKNSEVVQVPALERRREIYAPRVFTSASLEWLVSGYRRALTRFTATAEERDPQERFIPLFETLNWAVAIMYYSQARGLFQLASALLGALTLSLDLAEGLPFLSHGCGARRPG